MNKSFGQKELLKRALKILGEIIEDPSSKLILKREMILVLQKIIMGFDQIVSVYYKVNLNKILHLKRQSFIMIKNERKSKYRRARTPDMKSRYHKLCSLRKNKSQTEIPTVTQKSNKQKNQLKVIKYDLLSLALNNTEQDIKKLQQKLSNYIQFNKLFNRLQTIIKEYYLHDFLTQLQFQSTNNTSFTFSYVKQSNKSVLPFIIRRIIKNNILKNKESFMTNLIKHQPNKLKLASYNLWQLINKKQILVLQKSFQQMKQNHFFNITISNINDIESKSQLIDSIIFYDFKLLALKYYQFNLKTFLFYFKLIKINQKFKFTFLHSNFMKQMKKINQLHKVKNIILAKYLQNYFQQLKEYGNDNLRFFNTIENAIMKHYFRCLQRNSRKLGGAKELQEILFSNYCKYFQVIKKKVQREKTVIGNENIETARRKYTKLLTLPEIKELDDRMKGYHSFESPEQSLKKVLSNFQQGEEVIIERDIVFNFKQKIFIRNKWNGQKREKGVIDLQQFQELMNKTRVVSSPLKKQIQCQLLEQGIKGRRVSSPKLTLVLDQKKQNLYEQIQNQGVVLTSNESNEDSTDILDNIRGNQSIKKHIAYLKSRASIQFITPQNKKKLVTVFQEQEEKIEEERIPFSVLKYILCGFLTSFTLLLLILKSQIFVCN